MSVDTSNATATTGLARVTGAIKQASNSTGTSFEYLLATASMESDFNPTAGASTSSARGLYQFIDQTWLATVKEAAGELGYSQYADAITKTSSGEYVVSDAATRQAIMKLRDDPGIASAMAGALTQSNSFQLTGIIGRRPSDSELYMAHFMGVGGAAKLITSAEDNPQANAVRMFPNAAAANRSIFYDHAGNARSVSQVYSVLSARYAGAANSSTTQTALAMFGGGASASGSSSVTPAVASAVYLSTFPDVRAASAASSTNANSSGNSQPSEAMFRSLFLADDGAQAVSPTVQSLWGNSSSLTSNAAPNGSANASSGNNTSEPAPLDLFSDRNGTFSSG
jgi:hypothetical protein